MLHLLCSVKNFKNYAIVAKLKNQNSSSFLQCSITDKTVVNPLKAQKPKNLILVK